MARKDAGRETKVFISYNSFVCDTFLNLDEYVEELKPTSEQLLSFNTKIDALIDFIKHTPKTNIFHIEKGGSIERETATVHSLHADVSVFLAVKTLEQLYQYLDPTLDHLASRLEQHRWCEDGSMTICRRNVSGFCSGQGVHISLTDPDTELIYTADFYPAFDVLGAAGGDLWSHARKDRRDLWKRRTEDLRHPPSVMSVYTQHVRSFSDNVKNLIRLVTVWRKQCFQREKEKEGRRLPSALLLELLCFHSWQVAGSPEHFRLDQAFKGVLEMLTKPNTITASWTINFHRNLVDRYCTGKLGSFTDRILVVDPVNPWSNMAETCNSWNEVADVAKATLTKSLLASVPSSKDWNDRSTIA